MDHSYWEYGMGTYAVSHLKLFVLLQNLLYGKLGMGHAGDKFNTQYISLIREPDNYGICIYMNLRHLLQYKMYLALSLTWGTGNSKYLKS